VLTFKIKYSPPGGGCQRESIPIEDFYKPFFADKLPSPDSRFFRVAMKLDLRDQSTDRKP
jgi:hypothetical protein